MAVTVLLPGITLSTLWERTLGVRAPLRGGSREPQGNTTKRHVEFALRRRHVDVTG